MKKAIECISVSFIGAVVQDGKVLALEGAGFAMYVENRSDRFLHVSETVFGEQTRTDHLAPRSKHRVEITPAVIGEFLQSGGSVISVQVSECPASSFMGEIGVNMEELFSTFPGGSPFGSSFMVGGEGLSMFFGSRRRRGSRAASQPWEPVEESSVSYTYTPVPVPATA